MRNILALVLLVCATVFGALAADAAASSDAEHYLDAIVDRNADPRKDFFQFAVGQWLKDHPIPASERVWGIDKVVQEETYRRLISINEAAAASAAAAPGSTARKIGDFWAAAMDAATIAKQGLRPLRAEFARIRSIGSRNDLVKEIARLQYMGVDVLFGMDIYQDEMNSERLVLHLRQGGLGLPNRDYYFDDDARSKMLRAEYAAHVGRMLRLLGERPSMADANAATVMSLETELARSSRKLEALRDPRANYHAYSVAKLDQLVPTIRWRDFFEEGRIPNVGDVIVGQPEFFGQVEKSLKARSLGEWKTYLRWHLARSFSAEAGGAFDAENFRFYGTILNGTLEQRPRWKRMLDAEERYLGDALGELYVKAHFSPQSKARYEKLADEIFNALRRRIDKLTWMSQATQQRALGKLDVVIKKVGYPERWKDYSTYDVTRKSFLENCIRGRMWQSDYAIAKLAKPVDRTEWEMTPQTYNAYYNPSNNEIVLPAAIFVLPGIDDAQTDDALVYGYVGGTTIGHEITHGFDDQGRQFDEKGNLKSWWTDVDDAEFKRRAAGIVKQYNEYLVNGSLHVNGDATQGENIADLGGVVIGWEAFKQTEQYKGGEPIGGFTPAQRYFIGWAIGWMNQMRPEAQAVQLKSNVHAPSFLRAIAPVSNQPEFYEAFGVGPGDPMYRAESARVSIW